MSITNSPPPNVSTAALAIVEALPEHMTRDICAYCFGNRHVFLDTPHDVIEAWLHWNGIVRYTSSIETLVLTAHGVKTK